MLTNLSINDTISLERGGIMFTNILQNFIPISSFNKGNAGKIFKETKTSGPKIVLKNNKPEAVIMSAEQYDALMEMLSDQILLEEAEKRLANSTEDDYVDFETVLKNAGITQEDLDAIPDEEIEIE